jgi:DNA polymerase-3 subunit epsilon
MLTQARSIDFTATPTSLEAALLETDEIKRLSPPYNVALRQRDRDLVFTSRDFRNLVESSDELHWLGPVPRSAVEPLSQIVALAASEKQATTESLNSFLDHLSAEDAPDFDCLRQGWELFKERYARELSTPSLNLLQLGAKLWMRRRKEKETENAELEAAEDSTEQPAWTPERVCRLLEHRILVAAHWIRKVRWFGLLANSSVVWTSRRGPKNNRVLLVLESGLVVQRSSLPPDSTIPVSPGYRISTRERLREFDSSILDRLRVLTTELRRIVGEGGDLRIKVSPASTLKPERLSSLLQWV